MKRFLQNHWQEFVLFLITTTYIITFSTLSILRHNSFSAGLDLGNMDQTVWNTLHGRFFSLTHDGINTTRLSVHSDFLLVLFAPFYALWSSPKVLLIIQSIYLGFGALPTYLIATHILRNKNLAFGLTLMYLINPLIHWVNIFDFHMVSLVVPVYLLAFYFMLKKWWPWYWLSVVLLLFTKEEIGLQIFLLGLGMVLVTREKLVGAVTAAIGLAWSLSMILIIMPLFSTGGEHWAFAWYKDSIGINSFNNIFLNERVLTYFELLFKSFGFLPLIGLPWLLLAGSEVGINILSSHAEMQSIQYHYTSGIIPVLVIASIFGLKFVGTITKKYSHLLIHLALLGALLVAMRTSYHFSPLPTTESCWCYPYIVTEEDRQFEKLLQSIPPTATVTSSTELHSHVSQREFSYLLPFATDSADFIALIDQNRVVDNLGPKQYQLALIQLLDKQGRYRRVNKIGHFYLYKKNF